MCSVARTQPVLFKTRKPLFDGAASAAHSPSTSGGKELAAACEGKDELQTGDDNVKVVVRIRPASCREIGRPGTVGCALLGFASEVAKPDR